jgi:hypothetical protein
MARRLFAESTNSRSTEIFVLSPRPRLSRAQPLAPTTRLTISLTTRRVCRRFCIVMRLTIGLTTRRVCRRFCIVMRLSSLLHRDASDDRPDAPTRLSSLLPTARAQMA